MPMIPAVLYVKRNRDLIRLGTFDVERSTPRVYSEPTQPDEDFPIMVVHTEAQGPTEMEFVYSHFDHVNREAIFIHEASNKDSV